MTYARIAMPQRSVRTESAPCCQCVVAGSRRAGQLVHLDTLDRGRHQGPPSTPPKLQGTYGVTAMPQITSVGIESRDRIVSRAPGYEERAAYREAIANLSDDRVLELLPD